MKAQYTFILLVLIAAIILWPAQLVRAQDTLTVAWSSDGINPARDTLRTVVYGDTNSNGTRKNLNRVYKLQKGGIYWLCNRIENTQKGSTFPLRIVGEPAGTTFLENPPILQCVRTSGGANPDGRMITGLTDVTLKNLYLSGRWDDGTQGSNYQWITMSANNSTFIIDNCILEQSNFAPIAFTGTGNRIYYTNNKFRNLVERPVTQQWTGRGSSIWADQDTVVFENNTFFNVACFAIQIEGGSAKYVRFNHNTIVLNGRQITQGNWWQSAYITNNLIINGFWEGEGWGDLHGTGRDARNTYAGLFTVGPLPSQYGPEEGVRFVLAKNSAYLDPRFTTLYADTIHRAYFVDPVSKLDYLTKFNLGGAAGGHMYVADTVWLTSLPAGMVDPLNDANWQKPQYATSTGSILDSMWASITTIRANKTPGAQFVYKQNSGWTDYTWPLPENFSYTEASLLTAGTDGLPLGDLNWFPTQLASFNANKTANITAIENLAGQKVTYTIDTTGEAEYATLGGTSVIDKFTGFSYFYMQSGGFIQWDFTLTPTQLGADSVLGMNVWTHLRGNDMRGEHFYINGQEIHDVYGWGELEFASKQHAAARGPAMNLDDNSWIWVFFPKDSILAADQPKFKFSGTNTIKITPSWGYQNFAGIDLIAKGVTPPEGQTLTTADLILALRAPDATSSVVTPMGEGKPWIPSLFKSVNLGSNGTITFTRTIPTSGSYRIRIFGQNYATSPVTLTLKEGSTTLASPALPAVKPDTSGLDILSSSFALTAGVHTFVLSGANAYIDYYQVIKEVVGAVGPRGVPSSYALEQNFPNPFNPSTTIRFSLGNTSNVKLRIYNLLGQQVATLVDARMDPGPHAVVFDASKMSTGVYFYRLEAGQFVSVKKMLLLK